MADDEDLEQRAAAHQRRLSALSRAGGPLSPSSPAATTNNPTWFRRGARPLQPRAARRRTHNELLTAWRAQQPAVRSERQAIVLAGPPGAGKSTALAAVIAAAGTAAEEWRIIDSDAFKDQLLEQARRNGSYEAWLLRGELGELQAAGERLWPRELAALVHEEAGVLVRSAIQEAVAAGENIVIDGTLSDAFRAHELLEQLDVAGYSVRIADVEAPHEIVQARVAARWRADYVAAEAGRSPDRAVAELGGRWVPSEVVHALFTDENATESVCAAVAREVAERHQAVREYALYRVSEPTGRPELVEQRGRVRDSGLLDTETYRAARASQAAQPPRPRRRRSEPDRSSER